MRWLSRIKSVADSGLERDRERYAQDRARMQREEIDEETGKPLLWFDVSITVPGHDIVSMDWLGLDPDHARDSLLEWLAAEEWLTVETIFNGSRKKLTFRTAWVASFGVSLTGKKRREVFE